MASTHALPRASVKRTVPTHMRVAVTDNSRYVKISLLLRARRSELASHAAFDALRVARFLASFLREYTYRDSQNPVTLMHIAADTHTNLQSNLMAASPDPPSLYRGWAVEICQWCATAGTPCTSFATAPPDDSAALGFRSLKCGSDVHTI